MTTTWPPTPVSQDFGASADGDGIGDASGNDRISAADGKADVVRCGGGRDTAVVDAKDKVATNCEVVVVKL